MPELNHFLEQASICVPHLSPEQRLDWAIHCLETHPGHKHEVIADSGCAAFSPEPRSCTPLVTEGAEESVTKEPRPKASDFKTYAAYRTAVNDWEAVNEPDPDLSLGEQLKQQFKRDSRISDNLFKIMVIFLLSVIAGSSLHCEELKRENPSAEERSQIQALQIQAHQIVARISAAEVTRLKAELTARDAESELDAKNAQITAFLAKLREKYSAPALELGPDYTWRTPPKDAKK